MRVRWCYEYTRRYTDESNVFRLNANASSKRLDDSWELGIECQDALKELKLT